MPFELLCRILPGNIARELSRFADRLTELRIRADKPVQFVCIDSVHYSKQSLDAQTLRSLALQMMDHSFHAREYELAQGFFTMSNGCRVGVGGSYVQTSDEKFILRHISSLCIRISRPVADCALSLVEMITRENRLRSTLVLSKPGMGKTTILRDAARLLSLRGYTVGIADERSEIAACRNGIPTADVGINTDVVDGCPKAHAMEHLIRSMSPQIIITDEIGNSRDAEAIRCASGKGIFLLASAHAHSFHDFETGVLNSLVTDGLFSLAVLLDGAPGKIADIRSYEKKEGKN